MKRKKQDTMTVGSAKSIHQRGVKMAFTIFREMAERVPAYKKFLAKHHIDPKCVRTPADLADIPPVDKQNYLRAYPLRELCWDGKLAEGRYNISATSGSTGEPFYFPRTKEQDEQYAALAEHYLRENFSIHKRTTLYVNAFPMGIWIGGVFTYATIRLIAERGEYALSIINPGIHKQEILKAIKKFSSEFDQILIGGYGPFVKDIIDDGEHAGVNWKKMRLGFIFSAEGFTEDFRSYIIKKTGIDPALGTLNHYGTVDLGTMSYETPLAIAIRKLAEKHIKFRHALFGAEGTPTLTQYVPELFFFEERAGQLFCTARSGLPLFRYDLKDHGNVFSYEKVIQMGKSLGIDIVSEAIEHGVPKSTLAQLPFVQVFERSDFSVSFYAFQVYPETIRRALLHAKSSAVTGKFSLRSIFSKRAEPELHIHLELRPDGKGSAMLTKTLRAHITNTLIKESSEFRETWKHKGSKLYPKLFFHPYEDPSYFRPGGKQKWVTK